MNILKWLFGKKKVEEKKVKVSPRDSGYYNTVDKVREVSSRSTIEDNNWNSDIANPMNPISPLWVGNTWGDNSTLSENHSTNYHSSYTPSDHSSHSYDSHSNHGTSSWSDSSSYDSGSSSDSISID